MVAPSSDTTSAPVSALDAILELDHPVKTQAARWAAASLPPSDAEFDAAGWKSAAEHGIQGLLVDTDHGGSARSLTEALLVFEGLGLGTSAHGAVFALASQVFAMQRALQDSGSPEQLRRWLPALVQGKAIGSFAMSEMGAGSDTAGITTTATPNLDGGGWRLEGDKAWVTLAPVCDVIVVFATTDTTLGRWGQTAFLVPRDRPGVEVGPTIAKSGLAGCPFAEVHLRAVDVSEEDVLGKPGAGGNVFIRAVEAERAFLYAAQLGAMERTLNRAVERARTRHSSGHQIGKFQAVSHRIAEMKLRHETARLLVYKAAALAEAGRPITMAAALAKLQTSESAVASAVDAMHLHGAEGYTVAAGVEADLRNAVGGLAYSGTSDIQRNIVAGLLGVDRPPRRRPA